MEESTARAVVDKLRSRGGFAHLHPVGVFEYSVRMVLKDGREAIWDADGAAGLEAIVMRNGVLVGLVELVPDSHDLDVDEIVRVIANTDYDKPLSRRPPRAAGAKPAPPPVPTPQPRKGFLRRLIGG